MNIICNLPISFYTPEQIQAKKIDIEVKVESCDFEIMTFFHIDAIAPFHEGDNEYTSIFSGNQEFLCPLPISKVREHITNAMDSARKGENIHILTEG